MLTQERLWDMLRRVGALSFAARSKVPNGWNRTGVGTVEARQVKPGVLTFKESGVWRPEVGRETRFSNVFRWTVAGDVVRLEHLRFGEDHPVYLFDLAPADEWEWRSVSPHQCKEDCYAATMRVHDDRIVLKWSIEGPRKQETIEYVYSIEGTAK